VTRRILLIGLVVLLAAIGGAVWLRSYLQTPLNISAGEHVLNVPPRATLGSVAQGLASSGILAYPEVFAAYGRLTGVAARIRAGEYDLTPGLTPRGLLALLIEGRVKLHSLTIVEGWTVHEVLNAIRNNPALRQTLKIKKDSELAAALGLPVAHPEGQFFPDTYRFPRGTTDREILLKAHELMELRLADAWKARAEDLPYDSPYEALIMASIVERETALDRERAQVAGVFVRRLEQGMRLQADPTVIYGLGEEYNGNLTRRHLERDTPYNTYTREGLPPTPISLPGESSLLAALHPDDSDNIYFVATGADDGSHTFTATLKEHNAAVRRYLGELRERDRVSASD
jgi:UPF0755 protein